MDVSVLTVGSDRLPACESLNNMQHRASATAECKQVGNTWTQKSNVDILKNKIKYNGYQTSTGFYSIVHRVAVDYSWTINIDRDYSSKIKIPEPS